MAKAGLSDFEDRGSPRFRKFREVGISSKSSINIESFVEILKKNKTKLLRVSAKTKGEMMKQLGYLLVLGGSSYLLYKVFLKYKSRADFLKDANTSLQIDPTRTA